MRKAQPLGRAPELHELWRGTRAKIQVNDSGCWIWQGKRFYGYGPYRRLYERYVQPTPEGHDLHHVCRNGNGGCCNPGHLELLHFHDHRRMHKRENGVLSVEDVKVIRELLLDLSLSSEKIGERYGVGREQIERIARGVNFQDIATEPLVYTITCGWCGTTFETKSRRKRYCCTQHQIWYCERQRYLRNRGTDSTYVRPKKRLLADPMAGGQ